MHPRPPAPGFWPPPMPPHKVPEPRPWAPPPQQSTVPDCLQGRGKGVPAGHPYDSDYSSHYASHSQFYHPEHIQKRHRQPESFWFTQPPPRPDHWQHPPQNLPHITAGCLPEYRAPPPYVLQPHPTQLDPPLAPYQPRPGGATAEEVSSVDPTQIHPPLAPYQPRPGGATAEEVSSVDPTQIHPPLAPSQPRPGGATAEEVSSVDPTQIHPPLAPSQPLTGGATAEKVSSVELIKHSRTELREQPEGDSRQHLGTSTSDPTPPWLEGRGCGHVLGESKETEGRQEVTREMVHPSHTERIPNNSRGQETAKRREGESPVGSAVGRERVTEGDVKEGDDKGRGGGEGEGSKGQEDVYENSFVAEVRRFVQRNSEMFDIVTEEKLTTEVVPTLHNLKSEESYKYAEPEALEYCMQVDETTRRNRFFKLVEPGDVIRGHVVTKRHSGLAVHITSFVNSHKYRELSDLSIRGLVPFDNLAEDCDKCEDIMRDMQLDDVVQAVVLSVEPSEEILVLSFCNCGNFPRMDPNSLGYRAGRRPVSPRSSATDGSEFLYQLEGDPGFVNPEAVANLFQHLGLATSSLRPTLLRELQTAEYAEGDFAEPLRKAQRFKWSMKTVAVGVDHFKSGKHTSALQYLNHALDIDPYNVEGLVARGALSATTGRYKEGITDFRQALNIKNTHRNARNYLVETLVVFGRELEEQGKVDLAMACYREVLTFDPDQTTAKERLEALTVAIETQTAKRREKEREEEEEREKMVRLRRVIAKEKKKRLKEKRQPRAKKRKKTGEKKHSKTSKRHYSTSESSTTSDSSENDGGEDSNKRRGRGKRRKRREGRKRKHRTKSHGQSCRTHSTSSTEDTTDTDKEKSTKKRTHQLHSSSSSHSSDSSDSSRSHGKQKTQSRHRK